MTDLANLKPHPYADLFPYLAGPDRDEFVADIQENGLQEQIILHEGKILDGRNRYNALKELGKFTAKHFIEFDVYCEANEIKPDPLAFVLSKNLHRRQLTESQRAMVAANLAQLGQGQGRNGKPANLRISQPLTQSEAAKKMNVSTRMVQTARKVNKEAAPEVVEAVKAGEVKVSAAADLTKLPVDEQTEIIRRADRRAINTVTKEIRQEKTAEKKKKRAEKEKALAGKALALPDEQFQVILTDDEWQFEPYSRETGMDRSADNHYPTSDMETLEKRDVAALAASDCVIFMWATAPMLPQAIALMAKRGFTYKSHVVWVKEGRKGTGYWFRNCHEILLVGTRGNMPAPAMGEQWDSVIKAPVGKHSEKPGAFYELIETYYPNAKKIELNARRARDGWHHWGNEAPDVDAPPVAECLPAKRPAMDKLAKAKAMLGGDGQSANMIYRPVPLDQPTPKDILAFGDLIEVVEGESADRFHLLKVTGPYNAPEGTPYFTLMLKDEKKFNSEPKREQKANRVLREVVAIDGVIKSLNAEGDLIAKKIDGGAA